MNDNKIFFEKHNKHNSENQFIGIFIVLSCGILWGLSGIFNQLIFMNCDMTTKTLCGIRSILSGIILLIIAFIKNPSRALSVWKEWKNILSLIIFAVIGVMGMQFTYSEAIRQSNAATATVLQYIYPILMLIYHSIKMRKLPKLYEFVAILSSFTGIVLIATHGNLRSLCITPAALIIGLLSAFCYLFYTVYPGKLYEKFGTLIVAAWGQIISGLSFTFILGGIAEPFHLTFKSGIFVAGSMLCGVLIPYVIYGIGVRIIGGVKASLFVTIEPVASAVMAYFIIGIRFTFIDIVGFLCILASIEAISIISSREKCL